MTEQAIQQSGLPWGLALLLAVFTGVLTYGAILSDGDAQRAYELMQRANPSDPAASLGGALARSAAPVVGAIVGAMVGAITVAGAAILRRTAT